MGNENSKLCTINRNVRQDTILKKTISEQQPHLAVKSERKLSLRKQKTGFTFNDVKSHRISQSNPESPGLKSHDNTSLFYDKSVVQENIGNNLSLPLGSKKESVKKPLSSGRSFINEISCPKVESEELILKVESEELIWENLNEVSLCPSFGKVPIFPETDKNSTEFVGDLSQISGIQKQYLETEAFILESNLLTERNFQNDVKNHPCFKRQELKDLMKNKKDMKKMAKHFEKKVDTLQDEVEE